MIRHEIAFTLNGQPIELGREFALQPLSDTLRYHLRKPGTKVVCAEGDCGACTVMLARAKDGEFHSINSCIYPTSSADGCHLVTVEGLARGLNFEDLHEVQKSMVRNFGGQCGFCTPGFVMSIVNLYEHKKNPSEQNVKNYLTGNLCRCTGYQPIVSAALDVDAKKCESLKKMYPLKKETEWLLERTKTPVMIETAELSYYAPTHLDEALKYKADHPEVRIISGSTDLGVQINKGKNSDRRRMSLQLIDELHEISNENGQVKFGARVTLNQLQKWAEDQQPELAQFLNIFASPQIKHSATLVGNLANASPIGDTLPYLLAVDAVVHLRNSSGERRVPVSQFFKAYKSLEMKPDEIIAAVSWPEKIDGKMGLYKISQRRDLDISCVNAAFVVKKSGSRIEKARVALGGVAATPLRIKKFEAWLEANNVSNTFAELSCDELVREIAPLSDVRGSKEFRILVVRELWSKYLASALK